MSIISQIVNKISRKYSRISTASFDIGRVRLARILEKLVKPHTIMRVHYDDNDILTTDNFVRAD